MINYPEIAALALFVFIGWNRPQLLILFFIYTYPYIAGNTILGIEPPRLVPSLSIAFALIIIGLIKWNFLFKTEKLARSALILLIYMMVVTVFGLMYVNQDYLSSWAQAPPVRALRAQLKEIVFWLLPVFTFYMTLAANKSLEFGRAVIYAGIFYSGLGIIQFLVSIGFAIDIFPIIRGTGDLQSVANAGFDSRITSICGEPRYLSSLASLWFVVIALFGEKLLFTTSQRIITGSIFLATIILTGSRTGIYSIGIVIITIFMIQATGRATLISWQKSMLFLIFGLSIMSFLFTNSSVLTQRSFSKQKDAYYGKQLEIGPVALTIEPQDYLSLKTFVTEPQAIILGFGAGLAQYYYNPLADIGTVINFGGYDAIDSQRPNFSIIHLLMSFGLAGLILQFFVYKELYNVCTEFCQYEVIIQLPWLLAVLWILTQAMKLNDIYGQVTMFIIAAIYHSSVSNDTAPTDSINV